MHNVAAIVLTGDRFRQLIVHEWIGYAHLMVISIGIHLEGPVPVGPKMSFGSHARVGIISFVSGSCQRLASGGLELLSQGLRVLAIGSSPRGVQEHSIVAPVPNVEARGTELPKAQWT
jgi:hypothetical protein